MPSIGVEWQPSCKPLSYACCAVLWCFCWQWCSSLAARSKLTGVPSRMQWEHILLAAGMLVLLHLWYCYFARHKQLLMSLYRFYHQITKNMGYSAAAIAEPAFDYFAQGYGKEGVRPVGSSLWTWSWLRGDATCWIDGVVVASVRCLMWCSLTSGLAVWYGCWHAVVRVSHLGDPGLWGSLAWPVGLPYRLVELVIVIAKNNWSEARCCCYKYTQWSHTRTHTSATNVQTRVQSVKIECPSHCQPKSTSTKVTKIPIQFPCVT